MLNASTGFHNANERGPRTRRPVCPRDDIIRNHFVGSIPRNHTFFHFFPEGQKIRQRETVTSTITSTIWTARMRQGLSGFFPGVQNGHPKAGSPPVDDNGNPVCPTGAQRTNFNIFIVDAARPGFDSTALLLLAHPAPGQPGPMNQRSVDGPMTFCFDANVIKTILLTAGINM